MSTSTVQRWRRASTEGTRRSFGPSILLRAARLRDEAARLNDGLLTHAAKCYAPLLSPQYVSEARNRGGALGQLSVQILADPSNALIYAEHVVLVARRIAGERTRPLADVLTSEIRADVEEDVAQDALRERKTPETLRNYIERAKRAKAELEEAILAAERELEEMER